MPAIRALACGLVLGCAFGASATAHAQTPSTLTCSASATRLPVGGIEPAKVSADPCAARAKTTASLTTGLLALLPVRIDALNASTSADDGALADASVARVRIGLPGFAIEARMLTARSRARCVSGATSLDTSGAIGELSINGEAIAVGSEPLVVPLGLTTLRVNYETLTATGARRQALALESLLGPVVVGEAVTGLRGTPCTPPADPKPHSEITKSIGDSRTDEATAQPGDEVTYRMRYANTGAVTASNVVVRDVLDRQAYVACEPACDHADGVVSWSLGDVEPRGTRDLVLRATLPSAQPAAATLAFRNVVTATDQVETVESDDVRVSVTYAPKLVVTHEQREQLNEGNPGEYTTQPLAWDAPTILDGRAGFGYRLHVRNEGSAPAANLVLSDRTADAYEQPECQATPGGGCDELSISVWPVRPGTGRRRTRDPRAAGVAADRRRAPDHLRRASAGAHVRRSGDRLAHVTNRDLRRWQRAGRAAHRDARDAARGLPVARAHRRSQRRRRVRLRRGRVRRRRDAGRHGGAAVRRGLQPRLERSARRDGPRHAPARAGRAGGPMRAGRRSVRVRRGGPQADAHA